VEKGYNFGSEETFMHVHLFCVIIEEEREYPMAQQEKEDD
jgi:hypothetical protein